MLAESDKPVVICLEAFLRTLRTRRLQPRAMNYRRILDDWTWMTQVEEVEGFEEVVRLTGDTIAARRGLVPMECATWLVWRGGRTSAAQAVEEARVAVESEHLTVESVVILSGPTVEHPEEIAPGISLTPWAALPDSHEKYDYAPLPRQQREYGVLGPTSALLTIATVTWESCRGFPVDEKPLLDAAACVGLSGGGPATPLVWWQRFGEELPMLRHHGFTRVQPSDVLHSSRQWKVLPEHMAGARHLYAAVRKFDAGGSDRLRIALERLLRARTLTNPISKAIDLGIACETLLLPRDVKEQLKVQVSLNAAWLIAPGDSAKRKAAYDTMRLFYDLRSEAVHAGHFSRKKGPEAAMVIDAAISLCREVLDRVLGLGQYPNWDAVRLALGPGGDGQSPSVGTTGAPPTDP